MIYFIFHNGHIKIGVSVDPWSRLASLQTAHHEQLEMLAIMPGDQAAEREIHRRFAGLRASGEWFRDNPELREFIRRARDNHPELQAAPRRWVEPPSPTPPRYDDAKINEIIALFDTFVHFGGRVEFLDRPDKFVIGLPGVGWTGINEPDKLFFVSYDDGSITPKLKHEVKQRTLTDRLNSAAAFVIFFYKAQMIVNEEYGVVLRLDKGAAG